MSSRYVTNLNVHLVFVTKRRHRLFSDALLRELEAFMRARCQELGATLDEFNGETDHVHLLIQYPPTLSISEIIRIIKGSSARWMRQNHPWLSEHTNRIEHLWSPSYFAGSAGGATLAILERYIRNQDRPD